MKLRIVLKIHIVHVIMQYNIFSYITSLPTVGTFLSRRLSDEPVNHVIMHQNSYRKLD